MNKKIQLTSEASEFQITKNSWLYQKYLTNSIKIKLKMEC